LRPLVIPAMPNVHSHAFQRDLRGIGERSERADDDFWSWREGMYALAARLDPAAMHEVAGRVYAEMAAAGYGAVGEFHYVHHQPDGTPYEEPNAMAHAVAHAALLAGLRPVLLPAAYQRGGHPRFRDPSVDDYLARVDALRATRGLDVGVAAHSVRAVPADWLREIASYADAHGLVRHVHAHEQPRELEECRAEHGCSPIELLHRTGFLSDRTTVVHAIHVSDRDVGLLAETGTIVASCPTTEGNLGDGHFPALRYRDAGVRMAIGSDSNVVVDPFEEVRELETGARREGRTRHALLAAGNLWGAEVRAGLASLGLDDAGEVAVDLDHPRFHGVAEEDAARAVATCGSADTVIRMRRQISSGSTLEEQVGYSRAVVDGEWVHVSGTTGFDYATMTIADDVVEQCRQCLENVAGALAAAGASFSDVVRVRYLLPSREDFEPCWPLLREAFGDSRPAATMQMCGLADPRMRIEIEVTARRR